MKLIVGLGNPGRKYEQTRHNVGFVVAAELASRIQAGPAKVRFEGELAEGAVNQEKLAILCPHTFMNASGRSVRKACDFFKLKPEDVLVVCDDLNLSSGRIRLRAAGSAGGQKGVADIIRHLGTDEFPRLRIGIDRPPAGWDVSGYVLGKFTEDEKATFGTATDLAATAALDWVQQGISFAMNRYNADSKPKKTKQKPKQKSKKASPEAEPESIPSSEPDGQKHPAPDQD
ncbi:MAG: aminoacyl-tRNA hydrolase [Planctomycetota bacterium]